MSRRCALLSVAVLATFLTSGSLKAVEPLFFVNEPQDLSFADMGQVANYLNDHYKQHGITKPENVDKFYSIIRTHGAPEAGTSEAKVGLVVQDASHPKNSSTVPRGVVVITGRYDKDKVLEMLRKNYSEHMSKTGHSPMLGESARPEDGATIHRFELPGARKRELAMVSLANHCFFSSAAVGDYQLLNETMQVMKSGAAKAVTDGVSSVRYSMNLSSDDRSMLGKQVDKKYDKFKEGRLRTSKRRGLVGFFTRKIADHKVNFIKGALDDLDNVEIEIDRARSADSDRKRFSMTSTFAEEKRARKVKRKLLRHLVKVIKGADDPRDKLSMSSNIRVTTRGSQCFVNCELETAEEQMSAFALMSSYIAQSMLKN